MDLTNFLVKAKISTYANENAEEKKLEDGAKQLTFSSGAFYYRDRYYGSNPFIGEEVVFKQGKIIWIMNYFGKVISKDVSSEEVYFFLKSALRKIKKERPFRGPTYLQNRDFEYFTESEGYLSCFKGKEKIIFNGKEVYFGYYHGGSLE